MELKNKRSEALQYVLQLHVNALYKEHPSVTSKQTSFITTWVISQPFRQLELLCEKKKEKVWPDNSEFQLQGCRGADSGVWLSLWYAEGWHAQMRWQDDMYKCINFVQRQMAMKPLWGVHINMPSNYQSFVPMEENGNEGRMRRHVVKRCDSVKNKKRKLWQECESSVGKIERQLEHR